MERKFCQKSSIFCEIRFTKLFSVTNNIFVIPAVDFSGNFFENEISVIPSVNFTVRLFRNQICSWSYENFDIIPKNSVVFNRVSIFVDKILVIFSFLRFFVIKCSLNAVLSLGTIFFLQINCKICFLIQLQKRKLFSSYSRVGIMNNFKM